MGSSPSPKQTSTFDYKKLQINLASEISVVKNDERRKKFSVPTLNIHQIEHIPQTDQEQFFNFLCSKFDALKELSLDDNLNDGKQIEIRKIDVNKKVFHKKGKHGRHSKVRNSSKHLNLEKIKKHIQPERKQSSCENIIKAKIHSIDDLKEKSSYDKINAFVLQEENLKNPKKSKFYHHKKNAKSTKNKNFIKDPSLSTIKSKKSNYDKELNNDNVNGQDSLDLIRTILEEMGN